MVIQKTAVVYSLPLDLMLKYFVDKTQDILSVSSKLRAGICLTKVGLSAVYLLMLAGDVSKNPGPSWNTNLQNSTDSVDDILNGEPNFDDIADECMTAR